MERTSSSLGVATPHTVSNDCANAPATSAIDTTPGSVDTGSVGVFRAAPIPPSAPE